MKFVSICTQDPKYFLTILFAIVLTVLTKKEVDQLRSNPSMPSNQFVFTCMYSQLRILYLIFLIISKYSFLVYNHLFLLIHYIFSKIHIIILNYLYSLSYHQFFLD